MWPYFTVPLEDHIRQVWLYWFTRQARTDTKSTLSYCSISHRLSKRYFCKQIIFNLPGATCCTHRQQRLTTFFSRNEVYIKKIKCLMWPYFTVPLEDHIRQVWLYWFTRQARTDTKSTLLFEKCVINVYVLYRAVLLPTILLLCHSWVRIKSVWYKMLYHHAMVIR
jgi:hypothetical protein